MWLQQERIPLVVLMILTAVLVTMFRNLTRVKLGPQMKQRMMLIHHNKAELAKSAAFKVFGNISSKLVSGSFNNGAIYSTAAGRGGYIEGNTTIEVGTANGDGSLGGDGMAYSGAKPTSLDYSTTDKVVGIVQVGILLVAAAILLVMILGISI